MVGYHDFVGEARHGDIVHLDSGGHAVLLVRAVSLHGLIARICAFLCVAGCVALAFLSRVKNPSCFRRLRVRYRVSPNKGHRQDGADLVNCSTLETERFVLSVADSACWLVVVSSADGEAEGREEGTR